MGQANIGGQRLAFLNFGFFATSTRGGGSALPGRRAFASAFSAPDSGDKFSIMPVGQAMARNIGPDISSLRFVYVRLILIQRKFARYFTFEVIAAFTATIGKLPSLLV